RLRADAGGVDVEGDRSEFAKEGKGRRRIRFDLEVVCLRRRGVDTPSEGTEEDQSFQHEHRQTKRAADEAALAFYADRARSECGVEERTKLLRPRRVPQLAERLRFDLPDPLAGHIERAAHFFERVLGAVS